MDEEYDVIILGTGSSSFLVALYFSSRFWCNSFPFSSSGLTECVLSGLLSVSGQKVRQSIWFHDFLTSPPLFLSFFPNMLPCAFIALSSSRSLFHLVSSSLVSLNNRVSNHVLSSLSLSSSQLPNTSSLSDPQGLAHRPQWLLWWWMCFLDPRPSLEALQSPRRARCVSWRCSSVQCWSCSQVFDGQWNVGEDASSHWCYPLSRV